MSIPTQTRTWAFREDRLDRGADPSSEALSTLISTRIWVTEPAIRREGTQALTEIGSEPLTWNREPLGKIQKEDASLFTVIGGDRFPDEIAPQARRGTGRGAGWVGFPVELTERRVLRSLRSPTGGEQQHDGDQLHKDPPKAQLTLRQSGVILHSTLYRLEVSM